MRSLPGNVKAKWAIWVETVLDEGPEALKNFPGFNDESLSGEWDGYRSSRLSGGYRVIYEVKEDVLVVLVERVSHHDYKRRK